MLKIHHLAFSRSHRIIWLAEELGLPYELVTYQRDPKTLFAQADLRAVNPLGKAPLVEDDGHKLAESGAIIQHILENHGEGRLEPAVGSAERDDYLYWLHAAEGSVMTPMLLKLYLGRIGEAAQPMVPRVEQLLADQLTSMERALETREHFAGDFSAADIQMVYPAEFAVIRADLEAKYPNVWNWLQRMRERPAFKRSLERGGPIMPPHNP